MPLGAGGWDGCNLVPIKNPNSTFDVWIWGPWVIWETKPELSLG